MGEQIRNVDKEGFTLAVNQLVNFIKQSKDPNAQADFLTSDGFGNLRYYNGKFQYYNNDLEEWVDAAATPENVILVNMTPNQMQSISGIYDKKLGKFKLKFKEPNDTVVDGQVVCVVEKVIIRRKPNSFPIDENDGDLVVEVPRKKFGSYEKNWFIDEGVTPNIGDVYYYKAFPKSTLGYVNASEINEISLACNEYTLYGLKIDQNESDPASMITYIEDNTNFIPAHMNYELDEFDYGDWEDMWFIQGCKPCMLKYDGSVDYYLDPNDYSKKLDGTESDISNENYAGNAMVEIPKVYWKIVDNKDGTANVYVSPEKIDEGFRCWSHIDSNGNEIDYCYMPIYEGSIHSGKLRSLSGYGVLVSTSFGNDIQYALANNLEIDSPIWNIWTLSSRQLINILLLLIGKSANTKEVFGFGRNGGSIFGMVKTGTMDDKGMFYGGNSNEKCVKVFHIENYWGNARQRIAGWVTDSNKIQKVKMTYDSSDGSNTVGYNGTGDGYIEISEKPISVTGFISSMIFNNKGMFPKEAQGSGSTYYNGFLNNGEYGTATVGGSYYYVDQAGPFTVFFSSRGDYDCGPSVSCRPLASIEEDNDEVE